MIADLATVRDALSDNLFRFIGYVVRNQENIVETLVPDAGDNSNIASVDIFETEVVDQNFAEHTVEKIDIEKLDKD